MKYTEISEDAFHGSPYRITKFLTNKIGTGEGAQAFGWGLYFAGNVDVAAFYRDKLSSKDRMEAKAVMLDDKTISTQVPLNSLSPTERAALEVFYNYGDQKAATDELENSIRMLKKDSLVYHMDMETLDVLKNTDFTNRVRPVYGFAYEVKLNMTIDQMLSWYEKLSDQSNIVRQALQDHQYYDSDIYGKSFYSLLSKSLGSKELASKWLLSRGIKGIYYPDQFSRDIPAEDKTYNYVVFDDDDVIITKSYNDLI
ncbi:MAG: hypothetical protein WC284_18070 [Candidimonas sp.]